MPTYTCPVCHQPASHISPLFSNSPDCFALTLHTTSHRGLHPVSSLAPLQSVVRISRRPPLQILPRSLHSRTPSWLCLPPCATSLAFRLASRNPFQVPNYVGCPFFGEYIPHLSPAFRFYLIVSQPHLLLQVFSSTLACSPAFQSPMQPAP